MPLFVGVFAEMLEQIRASRDLDQRLRNLRRWLVTDPLTLVPGSRRARAEADLRMGEYLAMLGEPGHGSTPEDLREQELKILEKLKKAESEARAEIERDRDALRGQPATKHDIAQLAVDLMAMGRAWSEHFNAWSTAAEATIEQRVAEQQAEIRSLRDEIAELRKALYERSRAD